MSKTKEIFDNFNEVYSKRELEFSLNEDGLVIETLKDGQLTDPPKIIPGVTERDIKYWAYQLGTITYTVYDDDGVPDREVKVELRDIEIDQQLMKAYYYDHLKKVKKIREDGTF